MPKKNQKNIISKRHMLRRVAAEVSKICNETTVSVNLSSNIPVNNNTNIVNSLEINVNNVESLNTLIPPVEENINRSTEYSDIEIDDFECDSKFNNIGNSTQVENNNIVLELRSWATSHHVTHSAVTHLLHILKPYHSELPNDSRTLLKTPTTFQTRKLETGEYIHLGLRLGLDTP